VLQPGLLRTAAAQKQQLQQHQGWELQLTEAAQSGYLLTGPVTDPRPHPRLLLLPALLLLLPQVAATHPLLSAHLGMLLLLLLQQQQQGPAHLAEPCQLLQGAALTRLHFQQQPQVVLLRSCL
jgi:hypothetical protein